jgi:iron(III) transport system ATP-binding protein
MRKPERIGTKAVRVTLEHVTKSFGEKSEEKVVAVDDFTFKFPAGQMTTLLGPSGCGKTTTLRCIGGFYEPDEGNIFIGDKRVNGILPYSRPTGTVFQNYALFPHMTVFENVAYSLKIKKLPIKLIREKVEETLTLMELSGMEDRNPNQLSGGQQQRVAIARVLVMEPQVLLFDEPLSNLDAKLRVYMRDEIRSLQKRTGITTIYVTHDQEEAMSISDMLVVMNEGRIMQIGHPLNVYREPHNEFVAEFIGLINFLNAEVKELTENSLKLKIYDAEVDLLKKEDENYDIGEKIRVILRPEAIFFTEDRPDSFTGKIIKRSFLGSLMRYKVEMDNGNLLTVDEHNPKILRQQNSQVRLGVDRDILHVQRIAKGSPSATAF